LVARVYHDNMIKIQITAKVVESGIERADHLLEFIILTNETIESKDGLKSSSTNIDGLFIQNVYQLLLAQGKAAVGRADVEPEIQYKLINHYGRLLYLTKLLRYTLDNKFQPPLAPWQLASVTKLVTDGLFSKDGICPPPEGCSIQAFLEPLKPYISLNNPVFSALRKSGFTFSPDA
jgi:hypothetical protein